jgi:hypothetical protein
VPDCFAQTPDGLLLVANGIDAVARWDGLTSQVETAGVAPPEDAPAFTGSGVGSLTGTYTAYLRFVDRLGNFSNLSPISDEVTIASKLTITYTGLEVPTDPKITRRQVLRNTDQQALTYYVDIDTTDLTSTSLTSTNTDAQLQTETAVPILTANGGISANRYTVPPANKSIMAYHLGRMFYAVDEPYSEGSVMMTFGSATVTGIGTEWTAPMVGRAIYIVGASSRYEIDSVDTANQTLTLLTTYQGTTDNFALYSIRPQPAERRLLYWSEAGLPEAVPAVNAIAVQEDGDEFTGMMAKASFLYILEHRHIYRFTFQSDPALDGFIFLGSHRGCINNRCFVIVEDIAYMLDEQGVHAFTGGDKSEPISNPINEIFRETDLAFEINWGASRYFHAVHYAAQETIRWFVALSGTTAPRQVLAYNYRQKRWWSEDFIQAMAASCEGILEGRRQVFLGSEAHRILAMWHGFLDGADPEAGTVRGTATSATITTLTDTGATFDADVVGAPLVIVDGTGKGQRRLIAAVAATVLTVTQPWLTVPDNTSIYQVGGVSWRYRSGWMEWVPGEDQQPRRIVVNYNPTVEDCQMDLRLFNDFDAVNPELADYTYTSESNDGVRVDRGAGDAVLDLTSPGGQLAVRVDAAKENYARSRRQVVVELRGVSNQDRVELLEYVVEGAKG